MEKADRKKIEEIVRRRTREITSEKYGNFRGECFTRDCTERKIRSAEYFVPVLEERFGEKYPSSDWNEVSASLTVLSDYGPDSIDRDTHFIYAIAYFILDSIFYSSKDRTSIDRLTNLLDKGKSKIEDYVDEDAYFYYIENRLLYVQHPIYEISLVESVIDAIVFRNLDYMNYRREKRGSGNYSFILDSLTTSLEKPEKRNLDGFSYRELFEEIISLIPQHDIDDAVSSYKELFFSLIDCYLQGKNLLKKRGAKLEAQKEYLMYQIKEVCSNNGAANLASRDAVRAKIEELQRKKDEFDYCDVNYDDNYSFGSFSDPHLGDRYSRAFNDIVVSDPYKIIAGYFFLLEKGDDYAWLFSAATATLGFASGLLPWSECEWSDYEDMERLEKVEGEYNTVRNFYKPQIDPTQLGYDRLSTPTLSAAKYLFLLTETVPARYCVSLPNAEKIKSIVGEELTSELSESYLSIYNAVHPVKSNRSLIHDYTESLDEVKKLKKDLLEMSGKISDMEEKDAKSALSEKKRDDALLEKLESAGRTVEHLEKINSGLKDEIEKKQREIIRLKKEHSDEKEELNSLRSLIFSFRSEKDEEANEDGSITEWPYETKCSIAVVGGHSDWINKMKALLPDVKFYGDRIPDRDALKHTDVLWFQTKFCLSHPTFYKVIDMAKNLGLSIRYCRLSGVYSSAEAIVEDDRKREL